jgi:hypothetical protein
MAVAVAMTVAVAMAVAVAEGEMCGGIVRRRCRGGQFTLLLVIPIHGILVLDFCSV